MSGSFVEWFKSEKTKTTFKKVFNVIGNVFLYAFIIIGLFSVLVAITAKKDVDGTATIFGYQMRTVETASMDYNEQFDREVGYENVAIDDLPVNTMVFIEVVPEDPEERKEWYADLQDGDVLTFKYNEYDRQVTVTHRIVNILYRESDGGYTITLKGDNGPVSENSLADEQVIDTLSPTSYNYVVGKVVGSNRFLGWLVTTLQKPLGLIIIIILPCAIIIVYEIVRIITMLGEDKKKKQAEIQQKQQEEIESLKQKLASLENKEERTEADSARED